MNKKNIIVVSTAVLMMTLVVLLSYYFVQEQKRYSRIPPINAIPLNSQVVIEVADFGKLITSLTSDNQIWEGLKNIEAVNTIDIKLKYLHNLLKDNAIFREILEEGEVIISSQLMGKNNIGFLFVITIFDIDTENKTWTAVENILQKNTVLTKRTYDKTTIVTSSFLIDGVENNISLAISNGFLMVSESPLILEQSIRQLYSDVSFLSDPSFLKVSESAGKNVLANVYVNHKEVPRFLSALVDTKYSKSVKNFPYFASWSEFDAIVKGNRITLSGFTSNDISENTYLQIFKTQEPKECTITAILPSDISAFVNVGISDFKTFLQHYLKYLSNQGRQDLYSLEINKIKETYNIDINELFYNSLNGEMAMVYADVNRIDMRAGNYVVFKINDITKLKNSLISIIEQQAVLDKRNVSDYMQQRHLDENEEVQIFKMPIKNLPAKLFGDVFALSQPDYFIFVDDCIVFGSSPITLSAFAQSYFMGKTLDKDKTYREFANSLETNLYAYVNIPKSVNFLVAHLDSKYTKMINENINVLGKFKAMALKMNNTNDMVYSNLSLLYRHEDESNSATVWESRLDTAMQFKPYFFTNHYTNDKEIFVQDMKNKIYLISNAGRILWEKKIEAPILGEIYEVDCYKNNKLQLVFATKNKIHLIDRLGNDVENFPISLPSHSTNGLAVFDYDNNKNYRILTACRDKKIRVFDIQGKPLDGWQFNKTQNNVEVPIQYFSIKGKDYIVIADTKKTYILNRKGEHRVNVTQETPLAKGVGYELDETYQGKKKIARFVANGNGGEVFYVYLDGGVQRATFNDCEGANKFLYKDVDNDGYKDYLFAGRSKLKVFSHTKKPLYTYSFESNITDYPAVYTFPGNEKLTGVVSGESNHVYLLKKDGTVVKGFPVRGSSPFSIRKLKHDAATFSLITADSDGFLLCYELNLN